MKISLATNFDNNLIKLITKKHGIDEIFGRLKHDIVGGGRPVNSLFDLNKKTFESHVKLARESGYNFNYLINLSCTSNIEQKDIWKEMFIEFLAYLKKTGVNALTVSNPFILQLIKKHYAEDFKIRVSTFACVDSVGKAQNWEELGADFICLDFGSMNRKFNELEFIANSLKKTKLEMYANNCCLKDCPMIKTHANSIAHSKDIINYIDLPLMYCHKKLLLNPTEYISSPFIRPENLKDYEDIGVSNFKIIDRCIPTEELIKRAEAYTSRTYDGNLLDLLHSSGFETGPVLKRDYKEESIIDSIQNDIREMRGIGCRRIEDAPIIIENKKLSGFIDYFKSGKCRSHCKSCGYCKNVADNVITVNEKVRNKLLIKYAELENAINSININ